MKPVEVHYQVKLHHNLTTNFQFSYPFFKSVKVKGRGQMSQKLLMFTVKHIPNK